ncbi:MAG: hypothetical protein KGH59_03175 [Candidatus Micrarchaeota archaeon]|nr:hypothetical protein [Candidatus Micrarchaeota archaeon]MDE1804758.1 hypothetical protein [Candidatus Micrarchaeota archaeon]MDE1847090.1 hypothetical protein [Candidatus Micrarchaeota archaeon]
MVDQLTTTGIDALVEYLRMHGETEENMLAAELRVSTKVVEDWASVLERANMVRINYKVGKMYIGLLNVPKGEQETIRSTVAVKKQNAQSEIKAQANVLQAIDVRIRDLTKVVTDADALFKKNAGSIKSDLDELNRIEREAEKHFSGIKVEKDRIDKISDTVDTEMKALEEIATRVQGFSSGATQASTLAADIRNKIKSYQDSINESRVAFEKMLKQQEEQFKKMQESLHTEIKSLEEAVEKQNRQIGDSERLEKYAKLESAKLKQEAERNRAMILSNLEKTKGNINSAYPLAEGKMKGLMEKVNALKQKFGELGALNDQLASAKEELSSMKKEHDEMIKEIHALELQLKALDAMKKNAEEKDTRVEEVTKKVNESKGKVSALSSKVDDTHKKIEGIGKGKGGK